MTTDKELKPCPFCGMDKKDLPSAGKGLTISCGCFPNNFETGDGYISSYRWQNAYCWKLISEKDARIKELERDKAMAVETLKKSRQPHLVVDGDCYFSCPASGECCDDKKTGDICNCGAVIVNEFIDQAISRLTEGEKE